MMKKIFQIFLLCFPLCLLSQTKEKIVEKLIEQYSLNESLQYNLTYNLYKTHDSQKVHESYEGLFFKDKSQNVYMKINHTEFFSVKKVNVQISHDEKAMLFSAKRNNEQSQFDIKELLNFFSIESFKDLKTYWEIELVSKSQIGSPYSRILLYVGKDYFLKKQIFYYTTGIDFSNDYHKADIQYPRLEIKFSNISRKDISIDKFNTSVFFKIENGKIKLSDEYKNYQIIDQRSK